MMSHIDLTKAESDCAEAIARGDLAVPLVLYLVIFIRRRGFSLRRSAMFIDTRRIIPPSSVGTKCARCRSYGAWEDFPR
jgi:hypothetical protein